MAAVLAGALGLAAARGLAGAFLAGATIEEASVPAGSASTTNGIGVVAAGSGTLYGAVTLFGATEVTSSDFLSFTHEKEPSYAAQNDQSYNNFHLISPKHIFNHGN